MKVTQWFGGKQKPTRIGVYERQYPLAVKFCYWDGKNFHYNGITRLEAKQYYKPGHESMNQRLPWRGLAEKPK